MGFAAKPVTKHTALTDKEVAGVIDHAAGSVTTAKLIDAILSADAAGRAKMADLFLTAAKLAAGAVLESTLKFRGVYWFNNNWLPAGMIYNLNTGTGYFGWTNSYVDVATGTTSGSRAKLEKLAYGYSWVHSWGKKRHFTIYLGIATYSAQYVHLVTGGVSSVATSANTARHVGFKLIDNTLYGTVGNGTSESVLSIETISGWADRTLGCILTPGEKVDFYVEGVLKGTLTTNLPTGDVNAASMLNVSVYNTEAVDKWFELFEVRTYQEE